MASISTAGIGSGIDIPGLVTSLLEAERAPSESRIDKREAGLLSKVSAYGALKSSLSTFQGSLSQLKYSSTFSDVNTNSSNEDIVTASGSSIANTGSYSLEVSKLAQAQSVSSKSYDETSAPIGTGNLTFEFGHFDADSNSFITNAVKSSESITIDSDDNSLQGIRDAVNASDIGVTASLVNDGSGFKLVFTSDDTGKENGVKISVSDTSDANNTDDSGLSQLAFNPDPAESANSQLTENMAAQDATFTLNGLDITSASNAVSSTISGVTFTLKGTTEVGAPVNIAISKNDSKITEAVGDFVEKFNELDDTLTQLGGYNLETKQASPLLGDSTIRSVESQIRKLLLSSSTDAEGNTSSLATIGITTDRNGKLVLDSAKLQSSLTDNRDVLAQIFSAQGQPTDSKVNYVASSKNTASNNYAINVESISSRGVLTGSAAPALADLVGSPLTIDAANDSLSFIIDGFGSGTISLEQKAYSSGADLATELQSKINASDTLKKNGASVLVSFDNGQLNITSALYGSKSNIQITLSEGTNDLGLTVGEGTKGTDVTGTIGGRTANGLGSLLTGSGDAEGLVLDFTGGTAGNRGSINFNRGIADTLDSLLSQFLDSDSIINSRTEGLNKSVGRLTEQRATLSKKMDSLEARLYRQFNAMDSIVAQLQSTGSYLEQQLASLPGVVRDNN